MQTDLNISVDEFFSQYPVSKIDIHSIKKHFPDFQVENDYGGLLHAAVYRQYPEDKVLAFVKCLLEHGIDVNKKGNVTGYSFIHLALYGYTDEAGEDHSYSTEFIIKLIQLAVSHGLDVQITDSDHDSIIHTALASEVYSGKTVDLIHALGEDFDCTCKDDQGRNIYEALLEYRAEAKSENNSAWYKRLDSEEQEIKKIVELASLSLDELEKELITLKQQIVTVSNALTQEYLLNSYSSIIPFKKELNRLLPSYHYFVPDQTEYDSLWDSLYTKIRKVVADMLKKLTTKPSLTTINCLEDICTSFDLTEEKILLQEVRQVYEKQISTFEEKITNANRLSDLNRLMGVAHQALEDSEDKSRLLLLIGSKLSHLQEVITELQELASRVILITKLITPDRVPTFDSLVNIQDLMEIEEVDLVQKKCSLQHQIETSKETALQILHDKLSGITMFVQQLEENHFLEKKEVLQLYSENLNLESSNLVKEKPRKEKIKKK